MCVHQVLDVHARVATFTACSGSLLAVSSVVNTVNTPPLTHWKVVVSPPVAFPVSLSLHTQTAIAATMFPHLCQRLFAAKNEAVMRKGMSMMNFRCEDKECCQKGHVC